jgi:membrane protease YdiL (CAAX protease family)
VTRGKAVGLSAAFLFFGFAVSFALITFLALLLWDGAVPGPLEAATLQTAVMLPVFGIATWWFGLRAARLGPDDLRWRGSAGSALRGLVVGGVPATLVMVAAVPVAGAGWSLDGGSVGAWLATLPLLITVLLPAAFLEELIFRGVPLVLLAGRFGRPFAVVATSLLFGLVHLLNPSVTALAVGNVALAGVFLGVVFYLPGGLWIATGAHLGWNLLQAALAAPVSGLTLNIPWLDYSPGGPEWVSGGRFGPEGGVLATAVLALSVLLAARFSEGNKERFA